MPFHCKKEMLNCFMSKRLSIPNLLELARQAFNAYIRERDHKLGCITCGAPVDDAGHYKPAGSYSAVRYDEQNVNVQCEYCNRHKHGNLIVYKDRLIERWGKSEYERIERDCRRSKKWDRDELQFIIDHYRQKLKDLKNGTTSN